MAKTIAQRISLEGGDDIAKKFQELGKAGEQAFRQIQDAAKKPITDSAQIERTRQAIDQLVVAGRNLGQQFSALTGETQDFGQAGTKASQQVTAGLNQTTVAAQQAGTALERSTQAAGDAGKQVGVSLISSANAFRLAVAGIVAAITAVTSALTKGASEAGNTIADQAKKINLSIKEWLALRKAIADTSVSSEEFVKSTSKFAELMKQAQGGIARLSESMTQQAFKIGDEIIVVTSLNDRLTDTTSKASQAASQLAKFGVSITQIARGDTLGAMRTAAQGITNIADATKRAEAGLAVFGDNWEEIVKALTAANAPIDEATASLAELGKAHRDMTVEQVEAAVRLKAAWDDMATAISALKNLIGSIFFGGATARAEWLTTLIDGSTELLRRWLGLAEAKRAAFMEGLGETPAEQLFAILLAMGQQLAGIWNGVLVPAGRQLLSIVGQIAGSLDGVSKSQVAAFFVTLTAAVLGLSLALKGIGLLLTPITLLVSLFTGFGPVLIAAGAAAFVFWDQIVAGAEKAASLIPNSLDQMAQSFARLFAGDFVGFWQLFSSAAVTAFETIAQAAAQQEWVQAFLAGVKQIATDLPGAINLVAQAFLALGRIAQGVADAINAIFGTKLTATDIAVIAIVLQFTGALTALAAVVGIVAASLSGLVSVFSLIYGAINLVLAAIAGVPAAIVAIILAVAALAAALIALNWDKFAGDAVAAWNAIGKAITWVIDKVKEFLGLKEQATGGAAAPATGAQPFARGGLVGGRGSGTSDSNLAWISRGEHIMPAHAVRQPGVLALLEALRRSGGSLGRFALGGLVAPIPRLAAGGLVGSGGRMVTVDLRTNAGTFGPMLAPDSVASALFQAASSSTRRSAGLKPSRYGR